MKTTRGGGLVDITIATVIRLGIVSIASLSLGSVLLGLLVASIAIAESPLSWEAAILLTLLLMLGLALIGIIVHALIGTRMPTSRGEQRRLESSPSEEGSSDLEARQADALKQWEADAERLRQVAREAIPPGIGLYPWGPTR